MANQACPVFDANSELHQNLGLLKVAETAAAKHGDIVVLHLRDERDIYLLTGEQSVRFWHGHLAHLPAEFGDVASNVTTTRLLLGDETHADSWARIGLPIRRRLAALGGTAENWFDATCRHATFTFLEETACTAADLRQLCSLWAIRAVSHAVFGTAFPDSEMITGLAQVQTVHRLMSNRTPDAIHEPTILEACQRARAFLDRAVRMNMEVARPGDRTVLSALLETLPEDLDHQARVDHLRPVLFRTLFEKLNIDGLNLLWALVHLAQNPGLVDAIAEEAEDAFKESLGDAGLSPLAMAVAKETQRLYPELPFIYRTTSQDLAFGAMTIPARSTVLFAPWLLHRDGRYWTDPVRFDPKRFLGGEAPSYYLPLGVGAQARTRMRFTLLQVASSLHAICAAYELQLSPTCPPGNLRPFLRSELAPRGAVSLLFKPRCRPGPLPTTEYVEVQLS
jgi:hypothetical protein